MMCPIFGVFSQDCLSMREAIGTDIKPAHIYVCISCLNMYILCVSGRHIKCRIITFKKSGTALLLAWADLKETDFVQCVRNKL